MMKENMDKLEEETNKYVEMRREKKKKRKKKNEQEAKESLEIFFVHETGSSNREQNKKNKESKLVKAKEGFVESGESNNSETVEKESIMQSRNHKKKKRKQKKSELNEVEESRKFKTLEKESRIERCNGKKNKKKEKESELEDVHKKLVEYEDSINTKTLEKESVVELNNDKKKKKKNKREKIVSYDTNKEITNSEDCKGNNKCNRISNLEDDTLIEPENNDKIDKNRNIQDVRSTENEVCKSGVIFDRSDNEKNNKNKKKNMKNNKELTIDDELRSLSKQNIAREVFDKKRKKKGKKKLDDKVSHLDEKIESPVKSTKKSKLPHLDEEHENSSTKKKRKMNGETESVKSSSPREKKRKIGDASEGESGNKKKSNKENNDMAENDEFDAKNKKLNDESPHPKPRRVRFSSNVQVFPMNEDDFAENVYNEKNGDDSCNTIYNEKNNFAGKRFSPYEDQLIRDAVQKYIAINQLGEDGIEKILYSGKAGLKGCWKEISKDLPWRDFKQVYSRGRLILQMSELAENRGFSEEEIKKITDFHAQHGPKWSELAKVLQKNRLHIKDAYRRTRLRKTLNKGKWTQDEYQKLYDLVHQNICVKIHEKRKSTNPMTRGDISWEAISEKLKTRVMASCCHKWYDSLASPLVREEKWSDPDDYRLLDALYYQEACCEEDVDWDNLVDTRPGEYCQKRWKEMVRHVGEYKERSFRDQINLLKGRYDVNMLKYVEALKNRDTEEESDDEEENEHGDEHDADKDKEEENEDGHDADKDKEEE